MTALEQGLDSVTGAIARQNAAAAPPPAAARRQRHQRPPRRSASADKHRHREPAPSPCSASARRACALIAPVATTTAATSEEKQADAAPRPAYMRNSARRRATPGNARTPSTAGRHASQCRRRRPGHTAPLMRGKIDRWRRRDRRGRQADRAERRRDRPRPAAAAPTPTRGVRRQHESARDKTAAATVAVAGSSGPNSGSISAAPIRSAVCARYGAGC